MTVCSVFSANELDRDKYEAAEQGQKVLDIVERTKSFHQAVAKGEKWHKAGPVYLEQDWSIPYLYPAKLVYKYQVC